MDKLESSHVYYYVNDMKKAIEFYTDVLGLPLVNEIDGYFAEVDAGQMTIGLVLHDIDKITNQGGGTVSFMVKDIEAIAEKLKNKGAEIDDIQNPERGKFTIITDPFGNKLHMVEFEKKWIEEKGFKIKENQHDANTK